MNDRMNQVLDEITYLLKFRTKQVTTVNLKSNLSIEPFHQTVLGLIKDEGIPVLFNFSDRGRHRFAILLDTDPIWAFVSKNSSDKWNYMEEINEMAEAYNGD